MANVIHKTTFQRLVSVNTPEYPTATWLINPASFASTIDLPDKYLKLNGGGDDVEEMTQGEKDTVDAAEAAAQTASRRSSATGETTDPSHEGIRVRALIELCNKRDNYLVNRIIELQDRVQAMLDSNGGVANMRTDGLAVAISATSTRTKAAAVSDYTDDISAGNQDS